MRANYLTTMISVALLMGCATNKTLNTQYNNLGKPISEAQIAAWNIDIAPNGDGLPIGGATARQGASVYQDKCASCHGAQGQGGAFNRLVGGGALNTDKPIKTVGSYWPYATTLFDYTRRAMPHAQPQSLTSNEVYGTTAYILYMHKIIGIDDEMNAKTLPLVRMPNRDGFIPVMK
jgi:cytochrome c